MYFHQERGRERENEREVFTYKLEHSQFRVSQCEAFHMHSTTYVGKCVMHKHASQSALLNVSHGDELTLSTLVMPKCITNNPSCCIVYNNGEFYKWKGGMI